MSCVRGYHVYIRFCYTCMSASIKGRYTCTKEYSKPRWWVARLRVYGERSSTHQQCMYVEHTLKPNYEPQNSDHWLLSLFGHRCCTTAAYKCMRLCKAVWAYHRTLSIHTLICTFTLSGMTYRIVGYFRMVQNFAFFADWSATVKIRTAKL